MTSHDAERTLILAYAPQQGRLALSALLALDDALASLLRATREPVLGQMRLLWWRESLEKLDTAPPPGEPVLQGMAGHVLPRGVKGAAVGEVTRGWDALNEAETFDRPVLEAFAAGRGKLFVLAGRALDVAGDPLQQAGEGWALADLARHLSDPDAAVLARSLAKERLDFACAARWSRNGRALGAMAHLARRDLNLPPDTPPSVGSPARLARLLWHRLTGG
jgi:phytoene synthase